MRVFITALNMCVALLPVCGVRAATIPMDSERGDKLFVSQGCVQCHRLKGAGGSTAPDLSRVLDRGYTPADLVSAMWNHAPTMWAAIREQGVNTGDIDQQAAADLFASFLSARYFEMPGDAGRGKRVFEARTCSRCHGLTSSPNPAARPIDQWETLGHPAGLIGAMWNHSPEMWSELSKRNMKWPTLTSQELTDMLVYLRNTALLRGSARQRIEPGFRISESEGGAKLFDSKGCAACHKPGEPGARITLTGVAAAMWNHASFLHAEPPRINTDEMRELLSYYWATRFFDVPGDASRGRRVYAAKHCGSCHSGAGPGPALSEKAGSFTAITMLSALWRHGPAMLAEMKKRNLQWPTFRAGEMDDLVAALNETKTGR